MKERRVEVSSRRPVASLELPQKKDCCQVGVSKNQGPQYGPQAVNQEDSQFMETAKWRVEEADGDEILGPFRKSDFTNTGAQGCGMGVSK